MPSRADRVPLVERLLRGAALALLVAALWRAVASRRADGGRVHVAVTRGADAVQRDSLRALAAAGAKVSWSGDIAPLALMTEVRRDPGGGLRIAVVADGAVDLADSLGSIDSLDAGGGVVQAAGTSGALEARLGTTRARTDARPAEAPLGRVLVLGMAGWEAKFAIAALEEAGWKVDARLRVAPGAAVSQGSAELGAHGVVILLDSSSGVAPAAFERFVRAGGGLVIGGAARRLTPRGEAMPLATGDTTITLSARRLGAGRIIQFAPATETWQWRMQGEGNALAAHRTFWSRVVGTAQGDTTNAWRAASAGGPAALRDDPLPRALMIDALGQPVAAAPQGAASGPALPLWLAPLILALLVAEWALRRLRGAP